MKKIFLGALMATILMSCQNSDAKNKNNDNKMSDTKTEEIKDTPSIHTYKVDGLSSGEINFADFKGKKILVVNTASECGFTGQYEDLQKLYETYKDKLVVVGFPANNFGGQEPGSNEEIKQFCQLNYGVTFPMAAKVSVVGDDTAPIFKFLTDKNLNGVMDATIKWNFTKFLLDEKGQLIDYYASATLPMSDDIVKHLN